MEITNMKIKFWDVMKGMLKRICENFSFFSEESIGYDSDEDDEEEFDDDYYDNDEEGFEKILQKNQEDFSLEITVAVTEEIKFLKNQPIEEK
ncbi:hypothetical protein M0813_21513 [Anaeramoeba flamelloides]|uniref:Uncharacterized protein n=1 Tax=Anaeramoeba flamelloides TaxID=1746091 RepID=A0ABQ8YI31_9EUKA|nr:hypothetical protein M0813_21513 [Anaeramoeba flamelloides]